MDISEDDEDEDEDEKKDEKNDKDSLKKEEVQTNNNNNNNNNGKDGKEEKIQPIINNNNNNNNNNNKVNKTIEEEKQKEIEKLVTLSNNHNDDNNNEVKIEREENKSNNNNNNNEQEEKEEPDSNNVINKEKEEKEKIDLEKNVNNEILSDPKSNINENNINDNKENNVNGNNDDNNNESTDNNIDDNDEDEDEGRDGNEDEPLNKVSDLKKNTTVKTMTSFMESFANREVTEKDSPEEYQTRLAVKKKEEEIKIGTALAILMKKGHYSNHKFSLEEWIPCNIIYTNDDQLYTKQVYCDAQGRLKLSREWCTRDSHVIREDGYDNFSFLAENFNSEKRVICGHILPNQEIKLWEPRTDESKAGGGLTGENGSEEEEDPSQITGPIVYCKSCNKRIKDVRYYCTYCEKPMEEDTSPSQESKDQQQQQQQQQETSYNLCLYCIQCNFPTHIHPRLSFACQKLNTEFHDQQLLEQGHKMEELDKDYYKRVDSSYNDTSGNGEKQRALPKKCAFCDEGDFTSGEAFINPYPFRPGHDRLTQPFWAHEYCAYYTPGVYKSVEGHWFNVSAALERARKTKCAECKHRGATIKCFDPGCHKTYHLGCTHKQKTYFEEGMIFWCPYHERLNEELDSWEETYSCDVCGKEFKEFKEEFWYTCKKCSNDNYFTTFDLCVECYEHAFPKDHDHPKEQFKIIFSKDKKKDLQDKQEEEIEYYEKKSKYYRQTGLKRKRKNKNKNNKKQVSRCIYCNEEITSKTPWRYGYNGLIMCEKCFTKAPTQFINGDQNPNAEVVNAVDVVGYNTSSNVGRYAASVEDYAYQYYLTRDLYAKIQTEAEQHQQQVRYLKTYGPTDEQLYSLFFDYSYYDIITRAPRWATHSGTDYHGTWLPQIVRMGLLRYSNRNDKVLSNF